MHRVFCSVLVLTLSGCTRESKHGVATPRGLALEDRDAAPGVTDAAIPAWDELVVETWSWTTRHRVRFHPDGRVSYSPPGVLVDGGYYEKEGRLLPDQLAAVDRIASNASGGLSRSWSVNTTSDSGIVANLKTRRSPIAGATSALDLAEVGKLAASFRSLVPQVGCPVLTCQTLHTSYEQCLQTEHGPLCGARIDCPPTICEGTRRKQ
jgi:hypothetical protein